MPRHRREGDLRAAGQPDHDRARRTSSWPPSRPAAHLNCANSKLVFPRHPGLFVDRRWRRPAAIIFLHGDELLLGLQRNDLPGGHRRLRAEVLRRLNGVVDTVSANINLFPGSTRRRCDQRRRLQLMRKWLALLLMLVSTPAPAVVRLFPGHRQLPRRRCGRRDRAVHRHDRRRLSGVAVEHGCAATTVALAVQVCRRQQQRRSGPDRGLHSGLIGGWAPARSGRCSTCGAGANGTWRSPWTTSSPAW